MLFDFGIDEQSEETDRCRNGENDRCREVFTVAEGGAADNGRDEGGEPCDGREDQKVGHADGRQSGDVGEEIFRGAGDEKEDEHQTFETFGILQEFHGTDFFRGEEEFQCAGTVLPYEEEDESGTGDDTEDGNKGTTEPAERITGGDFEWFSGDKSDEDLKYDHKEEDSLSGETACVDPLAEFFRLIEEGKERFADVDEDHAAQGEIEEREKDGDDLFCFGGFGRVVLGFQGERKPPFGRRGKSQAERVVRRVRRSERPPR